ncbi:MAG: DapH/DapD/GlmU-related protein [Coriobacteriia bacterium]|nr:DapH/DapD/GlmU-related protein [Coriobacteriia bacterium]
MGIVSSVGRRLWRTVAVGGGVELGRRVHIGFGSRLWAPISLVVGDDVYIGRYCTIECSGSIGAGTLIANNVGVVGRDDHDLHHVGTPISLSPWIGQRATGPRDRVFIGEDVWIGFGAVVLSGIEVGRGAIIAAGAVVTSDVRPYDMVGGSPATVLGRRFTDDEIASHEAALASTARVSHGRRS